MIFEILVTKKPKMIDRANAKPNEGVIKWIREATVKIVSREFTTTSPFPNLEIEGWFVTNGDNS